MKKIRKKNFNVITTLSFFYHVEWNAHRKSYQLVKGHVYLTRGSSFLSDKTRKKQDSHTLNKKLSVFPCRSCRGLPAVVQYVLDMCVHHGGMPIVLLLEYAGRSRAEAGTGPCAVAVPTSSCMHALLPALHCTAFLVFPLPLPPDLSGLLHHRTKIKLHLLLSASTRICLIKPK